MYCKIYVEIGMDPRTLQGLSAAVVFMAGQPPPSNVPPPEIRLYEWLINSVGFPLIRPY